MALRVHALVIAAVEPLLRRVRRGLSVAGAYCTAGKQTKPRANACTLTAAEYSTNGCAEYGANDCASYRRVCCRLTRRRSRCLHRVLAARRIVDLKLIEALAAAGHRAVGRTSGYRDATRQRRDGADHDELGRNAHRAPCG